MLQPYEQDQVGYDVYIAYDACSEYDLSEHFEGSQVALVVGAFVATLLFGYLFRWTATARAVRPMLGRSQSSSIEFSLVKHIRKTAPRNALVNTY